MIQEVHENLEDIKANQKRLEEEVKEIRSTINIFTNQQTPSLKKPKETNTIHNAVPGKKLQILKEYGRNPNKGESIQNKKKKIENVGKPVKPKKNSLFNAIKSEEIVKTDMEFMKKDEIFIPRKFKEKITPQDTEEQKKVKVNHNLMKLKAQTDIQKDETTHYKTKYQELITEIRDLCPIETQPFLKELQEKNCKKEEEKSRKILNKKKKHIAKNLPQKEKENGKKTNEKKMTNINKQQTKNNTLTENIIPTHKQQHKRNINTPKYQIHTNQQKHPRTSNLPRKKKHLPNERCPWCSRYRRRK